MPGVLVFAGKHRIAYQFVKKIAQIGHHFTNILQRNEFLAHHACKSRHKQSLRKCDSERAYAPHEGVRAGFSWLSGVAGPPETVLHNAKTGAGPDHPGYFPGLSALLGMFNRGVRKAVEPDTNSRNEFYWFNLNKALQHSTVG